jgi:purine-nucleoside phosphorylase
MSTATAFEELFERAKQRPPRVAFVLGSGLSELAEHIDTLVTVPFLMVPGLEEPTVAGHKGSLRLGTWQGQSILLFSGRLHYYEGHPWRRVLQAVHICRELGVQFLLLTNAAGGIRDDLVPGSLMLLEDHIQWTRSYCWRLPGPGGIGPTRPSPYDEGVRQLLVRSAQEAGVRLASGIYAQVTGPTYETVAEVRALQSVGADAVGMSTAHEIQVASELGLRCGAISCITNRAAGLAPGKIHHGEVIANTSGPCGQLAQIFAGFLRSLI